jgi:hypothetical protein
MYSWLFDMFNDLSRAVMCVIVKNILFLRTNRLLFWEHISLMKMRFFSKDVANYAIFILVPNIYNPILNIKAVICMKRHTNYWTSLHKHTEWVEKSWIYTIFRILNFSTTHGNRQFKYQTLISCNKNAVYRGIAQTFLLEAFSDLADGLLLVKKITAISCSSIFYCMRDDIFYMHSNPSLVNQRL